MKNYGGYVNPGYDAPYWLDEYTCSGGTELTYDSSGNLLGVSMSTSGTINMYSNYNISVSQITTGSQINDRLNSNGNVFAYINSTGPSGENLSHAIMIKSATVSGYMVYDPSTGEDYFVDNSGFNSNQIFTF